MHRSSIFFIQVLWAISKRYSPMLTSVVDFTYNRKWNMEVDITWYPWERCPPWGRSSAMILSWGFNNAVYTWKFEGEPDKGCTFTANQG